MSQVPHPQPEGGPGRAEAVLAWIALLVLTAAVGRYGYTSLAPFLRRGLHLSAAQFGWVSTVITLGMMFSSWGAGALSDRIGVGRMLALGPGAVGLALVAAGFAQSFATLCVAFFFAGVAYGSVSPSATSAAAGLFAGRSPGLAVGMVQAAIPLGATVAAAALPAAALAAGWHAVYAGQGILLLVLVGVVAATARLPGTAPRQGAEPRGRRPPLSWRLSVVGLTLAGLQSVYLAFAIALLQSIGGLGVVGAGLILALMQLSGGAGRIVMGWLGDRQLRGDYRPLLAGCALVTGALSLALLRVHPGTPVWSVALLFCLLGFAIVGWVGPYFAAVVAAAPAGAGGSAAGLAVTLNLMGFAALPPLAGLAIDRTGGYRLVLLLAAALAAVSAVVFLGGPKAAR